MKLHSLVGTLAALLAALLLVSCAGDPPADETEPATDTETVVESESETETETETETEPESESESETEPELIDGMRAEFKNAMDAYEKYVDKFAVFMRNYDNGGRGDISLLSDFVKFMSGIETEKTKFAAWQENGLNEAETAYFADVAARTDEILTEFEGIEA